MKSTNNRQITITIDGKKIRVRKGLSILEVARKTDIYIPALCHLDHLEPYGGCRLCMVIVKNMRGFPTACSTFVEQGMVIQTKTPELQRLRAEILKLSLSEHPYTCLVCKDNGECPEYMHSTRKVSTTTGCNFCTSNGDCELQDLVEYLEVKSVDFPVYYRGLPVERNNPFYEIDYNLCILCGRCVRICNEERNSGVLAFIRRGNSALVGTAFGESQKDAGCEFCGACVDVCPTGSLSEKMGRWVGKPDRSVRTSCLFCGEGCTMNVNARGNRIITVGPEPGNRTNPLQLCIRGKFVPGDIVHHPDRIKTPLIRKGSKWIQVSWEEAISYTVANLERYRGNQFGMIGSGQVSMEDNYILQKFTRQVMRSNNTDLTGSYPDRHLIKDIHNQYLVSPPPGIEQIASTDTLLVIASDASVTHPMVENRIRKAYRRGATVIFASTGNNRTSDFATNTVLYKPGTLPLFLDELNKILRGKGDTSRSGGRKGKESSKPATQSGVSAAELSAIARLLQRTGKILIIAGNDMLCDPASCSANRLLTGIAMFLSDRRRTSILYLVDEGNRYGGTFAGMHPDLLPGFSSLKDTAALDRWSENWGTVLSGIRGMNIHEMAANIREDGITALFVTGDMPVHPDLANLKFLVQMNVFLTGISEHAHVFFPSTTFTEVLGHILTLDRRIKEINPVITPDEGVLPVHEIISRMSGQMQETGFEYEDPAGIFAEIQSFTDLSFRQMKPQMVDIEAPCDTPVPGKDLSAMPILLNHEYHYMGNVLASFMADMKKIRNG